MWIRSLRGKSEKEAREILAFGQNSSDSEVTDGAGNTYLMFDVSAPLDISGSEFRVTIENGKVVSEELVRGD
jgi:hypothetical protein